jgi:diguanylate cyclase (GGDEF)-like protein/PAS domain S-box-containing protein
MLNGRKKVRLSSPEEGNIAYHKQALDILEQSEQRYRELTEFLPLTIFEIDTAGKLVSFNQTALKTFRYSMEDFKEGMSALQFFPAEEWHRVEENIQKAIQGTSATGQQYTLLRKDGSTFTGSVYAAPIIDKNKIIGLRGAIIDVTEHNQTQTLQEAVYRIAAAAETTRSLDELYHQIHQIISFVMPAENFYITLYDEVENILRFSYFKDAEDEPFIGGIQPGRGLTAYVLRTGKSLLCTQAVHDELERLGEVKLLGVPSAIWLGVPLMVEGKTIGAMVVQHYTDPKAYGEREQHMLEFVSTQVAIAITRKRAEDALRQSEAELRALFACMHDVVMVIDQHGVYLKVAPTNPELLVRPPDELIGNTLQEIFRPDQAKTFIDAIKQVLNTKKTMQIEYDLMIGDRSVWFATSISPMTEESTLWVAHDITERKRFESVQNALYRISQTAITSEGMDALYRSIHAILGELIPAENFFIALIEPTSGEISFPYYVDQFDEQPVGMTPQQGLTGYIIRTGRPFLATQQEIENLVQQGKVERLGTISADWMGAPLKVESGLIGVMAVQIYSPGLHYDQEDLSLLEFVSTQVAQAIERKRMDEEIRSLSLTDDLTGLYNRRGFTLLAEQEVKLAHRISRPMLLFFCDVDSLKGINDAHGHAQGDLALQEVAAILKETFREVDIMARLGGDEFVVLAVDAFLESAETITNRIQAALEQRNRQGQRPYQLNLSMGIARCDPETPTTVSELIIEADGLMYSQKQARKGKR